MTFPPAQQSRNHRVNPAARRRAKAPRLARLTEGKTADPLTRLPNRLYFIDRLEAAIEAADQQAIRFAVLFIDLDQFKMVNDSLGHAAGDELLIDVARRLRSTIRQNARQGGPVQSVVARLGGDEFAVLLGNIQHDSDPSNVGARILERLGDPPTFRSSITPPTDASVLRFK